MNRISIVRTGVIMERAAVILKEEEREEKEKKGTFGR